MNYFDRLLITAYMYFMSPSHVSTTWLEIINFCLGNEYRERKRIFPFMGAKFGHDVYMACWLLFKLVG